VVLECVILTGEPSRVGDVEDPSLVCAIDSIGSTHVVAPLNQGLDVDTPTACHLGVRQLVQGLRVAVSRDRPDAGGPSPARCEGEGPRTAVCSKDRDGV
jgi:hypothetical protein